MVFNRRKLEDQRREAVEKEAASRRANDAQVFEDAERLIDAWNERQVSEKQILDFKPLARLDQVSDHSPKQLKDTKHRPG